MSNKYFVLTDGRIWYKQVISGIIKGICALGIISSATVIILLLYVIGMVLLMILGPILKILGVFAVIGFFGGVCPIIYDWSMDRPRDPFP